MSEDFQGFKLQGQTWSFANLETVKKPHVESTRYICAMQDVPLPATTSVDGQSFNASLFHLTIIG